MDLTGRTPPLFSGDEDDDDEDDLDGPTGKRAADDDDDDEEVRTSAKASLDQWHLRGQRLDCSRVIAQMTSKNVAPNAGMNWSSECSLV